MPEPILLGKVSAAAGGLLGGLSMMAFIKPKTTFDAAIRGGISTGTGIIFSSPLLEIMNLSSQWDYQLLLGFIIGFISWSILSLVAKFFIKAEKDNDDIVTITQKLRKK